jgi:uncharacterized protein
MAVSDNVAVVEGIYQAFERGDIGAVLGAFDENIEWFEAEHVTYWPGGPLIGPQAVLEGVFARIGEDFDGFRVDLTRILDAGDSVVVEARYAGTVKATGKPLDAQVAHVWDLADGKATRFQQYTNTWHFAEVTGVTPELAVSG